jgi:hypothetical protein
MRSGEPPSERWLRLVPPLRNDMADVLDPDTRGSKRPTSDAASAFATRIDSLRRLRLPGLLRDACALAFFEECERRRSDDFLELLALSALGVTASGLSALAALVAARVCFGAGVDTGIGCCTDAAAASSVSATPRNFPSACMQDAASPLHSSTSAFWSAFSEGELPPLRLMSRSSWSFACVISCRSFFISTTSGASFSGSNTPVQSIAIEGASSPLLAVDSPRV